MLAAVPLSSYALTDWQSSYDGVLSYLSGSSPSFGSVNGEWRVFALARGGRISPNGNYCSNYYSGIEEYVASIGSNVLDPNKATDNSRLVIALTSIGRNARNVAGYDLIEPLTDQSFVKRQGPSGAAFALLAIASNPEYGEDNTKSAYVDFLLNAELSGGGWSLGTVADPDVTAIVITALAPYSRADSAVQRGIGKLSELQSENGGYLTYGSETAESCAQVVAALSTVGIDCDTDERFIKNGNSVLSALCAYYTGSGFAHMPGGQVNGMASEQAAYALCAYSRMKSGRNTLYDMRNVSPYVEPTPEPTAAPTPTAVPTPVPTPEPTVEPTAEPTAEPIAEPTEAVTDEPEATSSPEPTEAPVTEEPVKTEEPTPIPTETPGPEETGKKNLNWLYFAVPAVLIAAVSIILIVRRKR